MSLWRTRLTMYRYINLYFQAMGCGIYKPLLFISMIALVVWTSKHDMKVKYEFGTWFELSLRVWVGVQMIEGVNLHSHMYHS